MFNFSRYSQHPLFFFQVLGSVNSDMKYPQRTGTNAPPLRQIGSGGRPELGSARNPEDQLPHHLVAYFALLPILGQLHAPWKEMSSFERSISVLSTNVSSRSCVCGKIDVNVDHLGIDYGCHDILLSFD